MAVALKAECVDQPVNVMPKAFHRGSSGVGATMFTFTPDTGWVKLSEKACR